MKKLFAIILVLMFLTASLGAVDIWFTWKANPDIEFVTSYQVQQKNLMVTNSAYIPVVTSTTNEAVVRGLKSGMWAFRVVAINGLGTSDPSAEVKIPTNAPSTPLEFKTK